MYSQYSVWLASLLLSGQHKTKHSASDQTTPKLVAIPYITTQASGQSAQTGARRKLQLQECPLWLGALGVPNSLLRSGILLSQDPRSCCNSCTMPCSLPHQHEPWGWTISQPWGLPTEFSFPSTIIPSCQSTLTPSLLILPQGRSQRKKTRIWIPALPLSSCVNYSRFILNRFQASDPHMHLSLIKKIDLPPQPPEFCKDWVS